MIKTVDIIEQSKDKIQKIAEYLVRENRLIGAQVEELMES